jgi:hypothetical protein
MRLWRFGPGRILFQTKETALLHANFAMDSISHSLQAFLMIAGGVIGLLAAFSLVDSSAPDSSTAEMRVPAQNRVQMSADRTRPGRRF